jgi:hypothetical protein
MAAVEAQQFGRRSHVVALNVPPTMAPVSIDAAFAALSRNFTAVWARMITGERDAITVGRFQIEGRARTDRVDANGEPIWETQQIYITLPAGQNPLPRQRDEAGLAESLNVLKHNLNAYLSDGKFERSGIDILGIRRAELFVNPGPRLLARAACDGNAWVELPQELALKHCCVNIKNRDNKCIQYCLIARQIQLRGGQLPRNPDRPGHYQIGKLVGSKRTNTMVPIECGLDLSMFDDGNDIDAQIAAFEEQNDFGVYIYEWKQHFHKGTSACAHPLVLLEPTRLHAQEVVLLLWKKHYALVTNFHAFKGG